MKNFLLLAFILVVTANVKAQFSVGPEGFTIASGTNVSLDGLTLNPSTDLTLVNNTLTISPTPLPGTPGSLSKVYEFSAPISFVGTLGMFYADGELNSNVESTLELVHITGTVPVPTTGSTVDEPGNYISNTFATAITVDGVTAASPGSLPVKMADFAVKQEGSVNTLTWKTTSEENSAFFEVQRSNNTKKWQALGTVQIAPNTMKGSSYLYTDSAPIEGTNYYRLKIVDLDGRFAYSRIVSTSLDLREMITYYPNPVAGKLSVKSAYSDQISTIKVVSQSGKVLYESSSVSASNEIDMSKTPSGIYVIKVLTNNGYTNTAKIVKP